MRSLPHPSYYELGNLTIWVKTLFKDVNYYKYLFFILMASITSFYSIISLIIGPVIIYKFNKIIFYLTLLYIIYFMLITGPVLSPKYIFPILPCIFLYQGITLYELYKYARKYLKI